MSIVKNAPVQCSHCGHSHSLTVYRSINTAEDPGLRGLLCNGSLFIWTCPECGTRNLVRYDCLFHDPQRRYMVWLLPEGRVSEAEMQAIARHAQAVGDYRLRRVEDAGGLIEKVKIFDAELDDAALELCKYITLQEMEEDTPFLRFLQKEGDSLVFTYPSGGQMKGLQVGMNVYEDACGILERNPALLPKAEEGFICVDGRWSAARFA